MAKNPKRDLAYYERRLIDEHPAVYADYQAGRFKSLTTACQAAGLMSKDTPPKALRRAWKKATPAEQHDFIAWIRSLRGAAALPFTPTGHPPSRRPVVIDGNLEPWALHRINEIMQRRNLSQSNVMDELGFPRLNAALWTAMRSKTRLRNVTMVAAIKKWLDDNRHV